MRKSPYILDTTLRDGEQSPGVEFSTQVKLELAKAITLAGAGELEVGIPAMGEAERECIRETLALPLGIRRTVWLRMRESDLFVAEDCGARAVHFSLPGSDILLGAFGKDLNWAKDSLAETLAVAGDKFEYVSVGFQDASRSDIDRLKMFCDITVESGADRIRLADTVGLWNPMEVFTVISELRAAVGDDLELGFHGHNDLGMASANALMALSGGADCVDVTVNGMGERAGNAAFEQVLLAGQHSLGIWKNIDTCDLADLCERVAILAGRDIAPDAPVVGSGIFRHESGLHVTGLRRDSRSYEPFSPKSVGRVGRQFIIGKHSGSEH